MSHNSLNAAFRSGSIAKQVGIHPQHNPYSHNNMTVEEEQQWFAGHAIGGSSLSPYDNKQEVIDCINSVKDLKVRSHVLVGLARKAKNVDIGFYKELISSALTIAEDEGDATFLRSKLLEAAKLTGHTQLNVL